MSVFYEKKFVDILAILKTTYYVCITNYVGTLTNTSEYRSPIPLKTTNRKSVQAQRLLLTLLIPY